METIGKIKEMYSRIKDKLWLKTEAYEIDFFKNTFRYDKNKNESSGDPSRAFDTTDINLRGDLMHAHENHVSDDPENNIYCLYARG